MCTSFKYPAHGGKFPDVSFNSPCLVNENRVIAPAHTVRADNAGERPERLHHFGLFRYIRLDVFPVGSDRHKPVLMIFVKQVPIPMAQQRTRILCTEYDQVHDGRIQPVPGYGNRVEGIPREHKAFPQAVGEPLRVKSRYVSAVSGLDDHGNASPVKKVSVIDD